MSKYYLLVTLVTIFLQQFLLASSSTNEKKIVKESFITSAEYRNVTQNKDLDNSAPIPTVEERNPNVTRTSPDVVKSRRRITPIMFIKPLSENDGCSNSEGDFPNFFTPEQRKNGAIILAFLIGIYCFTLIAIVCDNYFLPCVQRICETLNLSQDVAAATFMAMATSAPELFVNIIGTFITESDIGIGTVVGSSMFNTLGVGALGSLAASSPIQVDWWPLTRDCTLYITAILFLVVMTWDGKIFWYEGMILFIMYFIYFTIMFNNKRISKYVKKLGRRCSSKRNESTEELNKTEKTETRIGAEEAPPAIIYFIEEAVKDYPDLKTDEQEEKNTVTEKPETKRKESFGTTVICYVDEPLKYYSEPESEKPKEVKKASRGARLFTIPQGSCWEKIYFFYVWPIKFVLFCLVPNPKTKPKLFPITFIMCILFIGGNSYVISWMITVIGSTFGIPDAILGLTFLAAGGCLPEAMSIIIMSRRGEGSMGVSNALGANTMNILLSLGLPWFIKTMLLETSEKPFIEITSGTLEYTILGLMLVACALFLTLFFNKFQLARRTGIILTVVYLISVSLAITSEMMFVETETC